MKNSSNLQKEENKEYNNNKIINNFQINPKDEKSEESKNNDITQNNTESLISSNSINNNQNIQGTLFKTKEIKISNIKKKKRLGRKKKTDKSKSINNKFADSCLRTKCKHILSVKLIKFINNKIYEIYNGKIGDGIYIKKLLKVNYRQNANVNVKYNKDFLNKTIGDIFSENISTSYTNFKIDHNKILIKQLMEEEDISKKNYFNKLFNLTFLECLKHFRKDEFIPELNGLDEYENEIKKYDDDLNYKKCLDFHLKNYEKLINKKRSRESKKKKND